ncbi:MAG: enoyl-CoA hydratase/isomerase family protein [Gemmatimonadaceae bacterium]
MSRENVRIERDAAGVGTLTLDRPEKLNAFAGRMRGEIAEGLEELERDASVRVIVITGAGRGFCAGGDVAYMAELVEAGDTTAMAALVDAGRRIVMTIRRSDKPIIASVNGIAAGGGANLALACDMRIASDRARLAQSFNRIGLHPDWGGTYFLPRLVGPSKALELFWSAEPIDAAECERLGLFNRVVPHDQLASATTELARELAAKPALPLTLVKRAVYESLDRSLADMLDYELDAQLKCFASGDATNGIRAFMAKRAATAPPA